MIRSERGQAAIFVALLFNVLFVFFAMAINVALVVHDKINLQNSTDLAAYYAAAKQAEVLNAIAHQNYAIRQSYKLLAWRYRVLGTMGIIDKSVENSPVYSAAASPDTPYPYAVNASVCVMYEPTWDEVPEGENLCRKPNFNIPKLPEVKVIAGFLGLNHGIAALSRQLRLQFDQQCHALAAYNWWFAASILHAFRLDQRNRKQVIYGLAKNLSNGKDGDFLDIEGNSVLEGARQTFIKNLTYANRQSFEAGGGEFTLRNSMEGVDPEQWLVEIKTLPMLVYTDTSMDGNCAADPQMVSTLPKWPESKQLLLKGFPAGLSAAELMTWSTEASGFLRDSDFQFSIGVEKNPWYMTYTGVKVRTTPRQIFFPIGGGIDMVARSFAKPFGGRVGPWYKSNWEKGAPNSEGQDVDKLMAPRMAAGGMMNSPTDSRRLPNYSRYPGDPIGMTSRLAINSLVGLPGVRAFFDHYKNIKTDIENGAANDILAWDGLLVKESPMRNYEIAAIAPDLFDITYYSIEPNFTKNYFEKINANKVKLGIPYETPIRTDLGFNSSNGSNFPAFSIQEQMALAKSKNLQRPEAYYFVREKAHLLTSWLPAAGAFNYDTEEAIQNFGKCALPDDGLKFPNPGSCVAGGGRTGYSVKMVSRDALLSLQHKIGGGAAPNGILNPPPVDDGW